MNATLTEPHAPEAVTARRGRRPEPAELPALPAGCEPMHATFSTPGPSSRTQEGPFVKLLASLVGRTVTVIDPESFEEAPIGHQIRPASHRMKLTEMLADHIVLVGEFVHHRPGGPRDGKKGHVTHYVPITKIERVSLLDGELLIHV